MKTIEKVRSVLKDTLEEWCSPVLLKANYYSGQPKPVISYEVGLNQEGHVVIRLETRTGPFGMNKKVCERVHFSIGYITSSDIENQVLHALTFESSPFVFMKGKKFIKNLEVMG